MTKEKNKNGKKTALNEVLRGINKKFGKDSIKSGKDLKNIEKISSGVDAINKLLGGGFPYGYFTTLWGSPGSGKTTIAYYLTAVAQKLGKTPFYIALEPFDSERAIKMGVDVDKLMIASFPIAENSLDTIIEVARKKVVDVIILDSIHSLSPKGEQQEKSGKEKSMEDDTMALLARKLSQFFRIAVSPVKKGNVAILLIGQTRTSIGFIALDKLTGGNALKHYSKLVLHIRRGQKVDAPMHKYKEDGKSKSKQIGFDVVIKIDQTQISGTKPEMTTIHLPYYFESGFGKEKE